MPDCSGWHVIIWILISEAILCLPLDFLCKLTCSICCLHNSQSNWSCLSISPSSIQLLQFIFALVLLLYSYHTRQVFKIRIWDAQLWNAANFLAYMHQMKHSQALSFVRKSFVTFSLAPRCPVCMLHAELCSGVQRNSSEEPSVVVSHASFAPVSSRDACVRSAAHQK